MKGLVPSLHGCLGPNVYPRAPDGGWGWLVAVAFFFVEVFTYGIIKVFGIFLQDLTEHFGESNSRVAWIISICVFVMTFTAPLSSLLSNRFGFRPVVMLGGFLISLGTISSAFTTSITQMYITVGLVSGLGYCFTFLPTVTLLSQYFSKLRPLVTSVSSTGECFSLLALAPALSILKEQVGWRNCMMVIGLLQASVIGFGALLRPITIRPAASQQEVGAGPPLEQREHELENENTCTSVRSVDSGVQSMSSAGGEGSVWAGSPLTEVEEEEPGAPAPRRPLLLPLLRDPSFVLYSLFGLFATLGFFAPQLYVMELSVAHGVPRDRAAYTLSLMAGAEILGRLSVGWVMSRAPVRKLYVLLACTALLSLVLALFPAVSARPWALAACCAACGFLFGTVGSTHIPMLAEDDVLGVDRMTMGAGVYVFVQSFAGLAGPPLAGVLVDRTQDYGAAFYSSAAGVCVGTVFLSLVRPARTGWSCCRRERGRGGQRVEVPPPPDDFLEVDLPVEGVEMSRDS